VTPADLIVKGAALFDPGTGHRTHGSLAARGGRIAAVGPDDAVMKLQGPDTEVLEAEGATLLPGFCDAHCHLFMGGRLFGGCCLAGLEGLKAYQQRIGDYAKEHPDEKVITGFGWTHPAFGSKGPLREDLDRVVPNRPAMLLSIDYHSCWLNSAALKAAGIGPDSPDPPFGTIERDSDGRPTGCIRELPVIRQAASSLPQPTADDWERALRRYMGMAAEHGITAAFDAGILDSDQVVGLKAARRLDSSGELTVRISASWLFLPSRSPHRQLSEMEACLEDMRPMNAVSLKTAKFFMDGAIEGHTGYLNDPYLDRSGFRGKPVWDAHDLGEALATVDSAGFQAHIHTIGDGAVRAALDGMEAAGARKRLRHVLAHLELAERSDLQRMSRMGVVASIQPAWFYRDEDYFKETVPLLGRDRADSRYLLGDMVRDGVHIAFGSDWPWGTMTSSMDPMQAVATAVRRVDPGRRDGKPYLPDQRVSLAKALELHTLGGAWQNRMERSSGRLQEGCRADLALMDRDLFETPEEELAESGVRATIFAGRVVHGDG
jgi:hypothetical protein